jgi:hypothetical protein
MACELRPIYTSPRDEAHLRNVLASIRHNFECLDTFVEGLEADIFDIGTASGGTVTTREVVYVPSPGTYAPALATTATLSNAVGIAITTAASGAPVTVQITGVVESPGWGLTAPGIYYLSTTTPGGITLTAPTTVGQYVVQIGKALSADKLALNIKQSILL